MPFSARDWSVLLIGGGSGAGKTTLARGVSAGVGVPLSHADDFRLVIEHTSTPAQQPDIHLFRTPAARELAPDEAAARWRQVAGVVSDALEVVVGYHLATDAPIVLEGDTLLPALAARAAFGGMPARRRVRALFVVERDPERLHATLAARGRGFQHLSPRDREHEVRRQWLYGERIAGEAHALGLPVVESGPWGTLAERAAAALAAAAPERVSSAASPGPPARSTPGSPR
ncbi:MAG: hypothetical protein JWM27_2142 [Gemmatimonadetes bacterium]|nr:hypothetical protein [Gemmatimonadota bacterium]